MRKVKWGVIGAGGIADRRTIPGMMLCDNCELVAIMDTNETLCKALAQKYNVKYYYTSADELINNREVEAIYIASPVAFHKQQVIDAAKAHKHILCEKPIAISCNDSLEAENVCTENNVLAASGFMMRFHSLHKKMKQIIADGKIGQVVSCYIQMSCWFPDIDGNWRQERKNTGGGALVDMGIHCIDLIEYILSAKTEMVAAFCDTKTFKYDIDDTANVLLKMDNNAVVYVCNNYNVPDDAITSRIEILGTKGSLIAEGTVGQTDTGRLKCVFSNQSEYNASQERTAPNTENFDADGGNMYAEEIKSFADSIINNTLAQVPLSAAVSAQKTIEAAYSSSFNGTVSPV